ncbi:hypothetical protein CN481_15640 [Bacillus sp. AFS006103]|nr:hypothetical protein CN481_15640 [Bacillus sp. AFS006103]
MEEVQIILTISEDGGISAETKGMKGSVCMDELEKLFAEIDEINSVTKTEDYYETDTNSTVMNKMNRSW